MDSEDSRGWYNLVHEYAARDGSRHSIKSSTNVRDRLTVGTKEAVLYSPRDPSRAFLVADAVPKIDDTGEMNILPVLVIVAIIVMM